MTLSEKLDSLFDDTLAELSELLLYKENTEASYELMTEKYSEYIETLEAQMSKAGKLSLLNTIRISISAERNGLYDLNKVKPEFVNRINRSVIIHACSLFDFFINQTLLIILSDNPQLLSNQKRTIQYHEIVKYSREEILSATIEQFIHETSYKSISERIKNLNDLFDLKLDFSVKNQPDRFFSLEINLSELTEIFSIRNIIIHNQAIINRIFLDNNRYTPYKIGDKINLDADTLNKYILALSKYASSISRQTMMNFH